MKNVEPILERLTGKVDNGRNILPDGVPSMSKPHHPNPVEKCPIVDINSYLHLTIADFLFYSLYDTFYFDLISDDNYGDESGQSGGKFGNIFGDYLEEWGSQMASDVFLEDKVFKNPEYNSTGEEIIDVLIESGIHKCWLAIECKVARMKYSGNSNDYSKIQKEVKEKLGKAHNQLYSFQKEYQDKRIITNSRDINLGEEDKIIPVILLGTPYDSIATEFVGDIVNKQVSPYVIDQFNAEVLFDCLDEPHRVIDYINKRRSHIYGESNFASSDEGDYLGMYLSSANMFGSKYSFPDFPEDTFFPIPDMTNTLINNMEKSRGF